jgi:hypothetical protein
MIAVGSVSKLLAAMAGCILCRQRPAVNVPALLQTASTIAAAAAAVAVAAAALHVTLAVAAAL